MGHEASFKASLTQYSQSEKDKILRALSHATRAHENQTRADGTPYIEHPIAVAQILIEWGADSDTVIAGLLHDTIEDTTLTLPTIAEVYGHTIASLVEGVTKFTQMDLEGYEQLDQKIETLRRLLEVMRSDIRVIVIKLADRLHNLRTIDALEEERRKKVARETMDIYHKIAYHLGMNDLRRELGNLCIPILYPERSAKIISLRMEQEANAKKALKEVRKSLEGSNIAKSLVDLQLVERAQTKPPPYKEDSGVNYAYYFIALAKDIDGCYAILKQIHSLYRPISGKFRDYLAAPPESGYRSVHTVVMGPGDQPLQFRIRTVAMDEQVRKGILMRCFQRAHTAADFSWLERSASLDAATRESSDAFWEALQSDILQQALQVNVDGVTSSIPMGATALDAAYARFGEDAHTTESISVNGTEVSLAEGLHADDIVQVSLGKKSQVHIDWLQYVTTRYARHMIVEALKERDRSEKIQVGRQLLQKELDHFQKGLLADLTKGQIEDIVQHFHRKDFDEVISLVGEGVLHARDVVFHLYPEHQKRSWFGREKSREHTFRIKVSCTKDQGDLLPLISSVARLHETEIKHLRVRSQAGRETVDLLIRGISSNRDHFADFLDTLERQNWVSRTQTLITARQKYFLSSSFLLAFLVLAADLLFLPRYPEWFKELDVFPSLLLEALPLIPIFVSNYYVLRLLRHYVVRMRNDRWYMGVGFFLNFVGLLLILWQSFLIGGTQHGLLPLLALFVFSMFYLGFRFFQTEELFLHIDEQKLKPLTKLQWKKLRQKKMLGYGLRLGAVTLWGIDPLFHKYTPASEVDPFVRIFLLSVGVLLANWIALGLKGMFFPKKKISLEIPRDVLLLNIIIGMALFRYLLTVSLLFTTSTNFILLNNFSPVLALLIAALLWRSQIAYLRQPKHMLWVFLIFLMGSTGSALILYNDVQFPGAGTLQGDLIGMVAMAMDTLLVISQIRYMKIHTRASSIAISLHVFSFLALTTLPFMMYLYGIGHESIWSLTRTAILFGIASGVLLGVGQIFNYEAFRRVDGFIAFLMFNISILITFVFEVFFLGKFTPTWVLLVGGLIIIASTILAEFINSHCQKKGL